jgi:hypothetical protein
MYAHIENCCQETEELRVVSYHDHYEAEIFVNGNITDIIGEGPTIEEALKDLDHKLEDVKIEKLRGVR